MLPEAAVSRGDAALERIREPGVTRKLVGIEAPASHNEYLRLIQAATRRCLELTADSRRVQAGHMRSARLEDSHLVPAEGHLFSAGSSHERKCTQARQLGAVAVLARRQATPSFRPPQRLVR